MGVHGGRRIHPEPFAYRGVDFTPTWFETFSGLQLHALVGERPPADSDRALIAIHSPTAHGHSWLPVVTRMEHGRFVLPDLRGHGYSDWSREGYWLAQHARDLRALCDQLPYRELDLVAPSLGGRIAVLLAAELGPRVRRLVLLDSAPEISATAAAKVTTISSSNGRRTAFTDEAQIVQFWGEEQPTWEAEALAVRARHLYRRNWADRLVSANDPELAFLFGRAAAAESEQVWAALSKVSAHTVVVRGRDSYFTDADQTRRMVDLLPDGRHLEIDAGHYLGYEDAAGIATLLDDLLA